MGQKREVNVYNLIAQDTIDVSNREALWNGRSIRLTDSAASPMQEVIDRVGKSKLALGQAVTGQEQVEDVDLQIAVLEALNAESA